MRWRLDLFRLIQALRRLKWNQKFTKSIRRSSIRKGRERTAGSQAPVSLLQPPANEDSGLTFPGG